MKFEEAYYAPNGDLVSIDQVTNVFKFKNSKFNEEFYGQLYCPECHLAKLSYNNASTPYFRSYPNALHDENCLLQQKEMTSHEVKTHVSDTKNWDDIINQLKRTLRRLSVSQHTDVMKNELSTTDLSKKHYIKHSHDATLLRLPQKRIDLPFSSEDYECLKLFYGFVFLRWEYDAVKVKYKLLLYHPVTKKMLCKIMITKQVYSYIPDHYKIIEEKLCSIAFLANIPKVENRSYHTFSLQYGQFLVLNDISISFLP